MQYSTMATCGRAHLYVILCAFEVILGEVHLVHFLQNIPPHIPHRHLLTPYTQHLASVQL